MSDEVGDWLAAGAGGDEPCERVVETSIARVFLYPDRVLKLKRPVDFGFVDFTTLEARRDAVGRELAYNRATAPDLYRAFHAVVRRADGRLALDGVGETIDWVLEMGRFPDGALLADQPGAIDGAMGEALGREVARLHLAAPVAGPPERLDYVLDSNESLLRPQAARLGGEAGLDSILAETRRAYERLRPMLAERAAAGLKRRCHGDLHLKNVFLQDGRPVLFDCIEFNDLLSDIDLAYDIAFLLMDLSFRGAAEAANRALNGWLDGVARGLPQAHVWSGLAALPLFQAVRAAVRAHVGLHQGEEEAARRYIAAAAAHLAPAPPRLVAVGGLSGSGKSTQARRIAPGLGPSPGAVVLRSDEVRKRLWGRAPLDRLPPEAYSREAGETTYAALYEAARACLAAGWAVVLDAAFLRPEERAAAEAAARDAGVPFEGVWMDAPAEVLRSRVSTRTGDASDADVAVLERQLALDLGPIGWRRHDAVSGPG